MKLDRILDQLNSLEKNSFLKVVDTLISGNPKNIKAIDKILNDASGDLKAMDSINISKVFSLLQDEFVEHLSSAFLRTTTQLGLLTDIIIRDGNCIMKQDWFSRLYETELKELKRKIKTFKHLLDDPKNEIDPARHRDYLIYLACIKTAYENDDLNNQERKITFEEQTILNTLSDKLELSNEEVRLLNYFILPIHHMPIDAVINELKNLGLIFYSKKSNILYVSDEIVFLIRGIKGKSVADKYFRRVLRQLRDPQINMIARKHNIDRHLTVELKIKEIIKEGISFRGVLSSDIFKEDTLVTEKKKVLNDLCDNKLKLNLTNKGVTLEDKINNIVQHFEEVEKDDKVGISVDGYDKLLLDLSRTIPKANKTLKVEFELQDENVMSSSMLLDFNIKPRDVLEILPEKELKAFTEKQGISTRGDIIGNILENYKDSENLYLENFTSVGYRDLATLKENGLMVKESELGLLFEDLTKKIFSKLGLEVDDSLKARLNTNKDKVDILVNLGDHNLILIECKSVKESGYNKFSSVSRQLKSYMSLADKNGYKVIKSLLVAPEFSDDFIKECGLDYELNLSLITANALRKILEAFKDSKHSTFPYNLLMRDVLIQEDRVIKAIDK